MKTYYVDLVIRGCPPDSVMGEEPMIVATRVAVQVPDVMEADEISEAIGNEVQKIGVHFINSDQLSVSIDKYEETRENVEVPPEYRPN